MAGMSFGATGTRRDRGHERLAPRAGLPEVPGARFVAFSTGNLGGLTPVAHGGSEETDVPAQGHYAMSCLGRERIFKHHRFSPFRVPHTDCTAVQGRGAIV